MINIPHSLLLVGITALVTYLLRAIPFWIFNGKDTLPPLMKKITDLLPPAIIAVLIIYCVKSDIISISMSSLASLVALVVVALIHLWKRNTLMSIAIGTAIYMVLIRVLPF